MKKLISTMLFLLLALSCLSVSTAEKYWKMYWKPGDRIVEMTPEEDGQFTGIIEEAVRKSEGTTVRLGADHESDLEAAYAVFLSVSPDGTPIGPYEDSVNYEDIGCYKWAVGIPDDQSVGRDEAWKNILKFLVDEGISTPEILVHYYPQAAYETGNDPENPVWRIILACYDHEKSGLPIAAYELSVYAHDGSICGYRDLNPDG